MAVQGVGPSHHLLSPCPLGLAAWEEYPTLKMLMEMVMTKYGGAHPAGTGPPGAGPVPPRRGAERRPVSWVPLELPSPSPPGFTHFPLRGAGVEAAGSPGRPGQHTCQTDRWCDARSERGTGSQTGFGRWRQGTQGSS